MSDNSFVVARLAPILSRIRDGLRKAPGSTRIELVDLDGNTTFRVLSPTIATLLCLLKNVTAGDIESAAEYLANLGLKKDARQLCLLREWLLDRWARESAAPEVPPESSIMEHRTKKLSARVLAFQSYVDDLLSMINAKGRGGVEQARSRSGGIGWRDVQCRLDGLRLKGEEFTSYADLAEKMTCSASTVNKAIKNGTVELQEWASKEHRSSRRNVSPEAAAVALESASQSRESAPSEVVDPKDEDAALSYVKREAEKLGGAPAMAQLESLDPAARRKVAELVYRDPDMTEQAERHWKAKMQKRGD